MEEEIDIKELIQNIWQKRLILIFIMIICSLAFFMYNVYFMKPEYIATSKLILTNVISESEKTINLSDSITQNDLNLNELLINSYTEIITSNSVLEKVKDNCKLDININELKKNISLEVNSNIISIIIKSNDSSDAKKIADEIAIVFSNRITELYKIKNIQVLDNAIEDLKPININPQKYALIGLLVGMITSVGFIVFLDFLNPKIKNIDTLEGITGVPVLTTISKYKKSKFLSTTIDNKNTIIDEFNILRTNIEYGLKENVKTVLFTSTEVGDGKSWTSANFAASLVRIGKKVLIIDTDNRRGKQHEIFNLDKENGLSEYLISDGNDYEKYIKKTNENNLDVITGGKEIIRFSELLMSKKLEELLNKLKEEYDYIILDTIPNLVLTDGIILSRLVDTCICIVKYNSTKINEFNKIKKNIEKVGGNVSGLVINQIPNMKYKKLLFYKKDLVENCIK